MSSLPEFVSGSNSIYYKIQFFRNIYPYNSEVIFWLDKLLTFFIHSKDFHGFITMQYRERTSSSHLNLNQSWFEELSVLLCCFEVFLITFDCCAFLTRELDCSDGLRSPLKGRIVSWNWLQSTYICLNVKMLKTNFLNLPALGKSF